MRLHESVGYAGKMEDPSILTPAETALSLLFRKLHPHLEDVAHALAKGASRRDLERLHLKLLTARMKTVEVLSNTLEALPEEDPLAELLETLAANLTPVGESFRQSLILTQLCLEEAPADLLPYLPEGRVAASNWGARMKDFLAHLQEPGFQAHQRWEGIEEDIGETEEG